MPNEKTTWDSVARRIHLDRSSPLSLHEQLRERMAAQIASGRLAPGLRVPPVRELARALDLAPGTVARAYRELEQGGLLVGRGRHGTFVSETLPELPPEVDVRLGEAARAFASRARQLGFAPEEALRRVRRELRGG